MVALSVTAPRFTVEDEAKENAALTEEKRREVADDLFGDHEEMEGEEAEKDDDAEFRSAMQLEMEGNIAAMDPKDKYAYDEAMRLCPHLVVTETPAIVFLRREGYNPERAAIRIVKYWQCRKKLFRENAFRPMTLENGTMDQDDVLALTLGACGFLPRDKAGRATIYASNGIHQNHASVSSESMLRAQWFMLHTASEEERCQRFGAVFIVNYRGVLVDDACRKREKMLWSSIRDCLPIRIRAIHCCYPRNVLGMFFPVLKQLLGKELRQRFVVHKAEVKSEILASLKKYGFKDTGLPKSLGGRCEWDPARWVQGRIVVAQPSRREAQVNGGVFGHRDDSHHLLASPGKKVSPRKEKYSKPTVSLPSSPAVSGRRKPLQRGYSAPRLYGNRSTKPLCALSA